MNSRISFVRHVRVPMTNAARARGITKRVPSAADPRAQLKRLSSIAAMVVAMHWVIAVAVVCMAEEVCLVTAVARRVLAAAALRVVSVAVIIALMGVVAWVVVAVRLAAVCLALTPIRVTAVIATTTETPT